MLPHDVCARVGRPRGSYVRQRVPVQDFPAVRQNILPQRGDDARKRVRAQMRLCLIDDFLLSAVRGKDAQHLRVSALRVAHGGRQLAVGKSARAALAELDVGVR